MANTNSSVTAIANNAVDAENCSDWQAEQIERNGIRQALAGAKLRAESHPNAIGYTVKEVKHA